MLGYSIDMAQRRLPLDERIRQIIRDSGISLYRIAKETRIDISHLSRFMRKERGFTLDHVDRLFDYLGWEIVFKKPRRRGGRS